MTSPRFSVTPLLTLVGVGPNDVIRRQYRVTCLDCGKVVSEGPITNKAKNDHRCHGAPA